MDSPLTAVCFRYPRQKIGAMVTLAALKGVPRTRTTHPDGILLLCC